MYARQPTEYWENIIFVDESKYSFFGSDGKQKVWWKSNTAMRVKNVRPSINYGGTRNQIVRDDGIMNKYVYLDILKRNLRKSASKLGISEHFKLYQDNDPKHTANICKLWVIYHRPGVIKTPVQSPDLNPIEHVWDYLQQKL
ncbi:transposable element Tcb1 transposase [Trichonephila clavipes]|nr:transposable element Tcb1 transposase [Trichonephila clavipes]